MAALITLIPLNSFSEENADYLQEEDQIFNFGTEIDFNSRYVWRGIALSEGAVMQPSVWISAFNFTFYIWGNFILNDEPNQGEFNEIELILYYSREWGKVTFEPFVVYYVYPNQEDVPSTGEVTLNLYYSFGPFNIFTSHTFDFVEYEGSYFGDAGLSYEHQLSSTLTLEASSSFGWASSEFNSVNIGLSKSAFNFAGGNLSLTYYPKEFLYFRPHIEFSAIVDGELRDQLDDPTILNVGVAVGMEF
ncbi:MAG TPA: TorF family putative porin [Thermodesulfobacteriota bacterium]|nr:TorF family putative porin [Thermodesulfobacteriota bacterium]